MAGRIDIRRPAAPRRRVAVVLAALLVFQIPLTAATIRVEGTCSLVDAINAANTDAVVGDCPAGAGADTIELTAGVTLTDWDNSTDGVNGLPSATTEITIEGNGHTIARDTSESVSSFRLLHVGADGDLTLKNTTVSGGEGLVPFITRGGGIFNRGTLMLENSALKDNSIYGKIAPNNWFFAYGGGLYNLGSAILRNSTVQSNSIFLRPLWDPGGLYPETRAFGAGIFAGAGSETILENTTVSSNTGTVIFTVPFGQVFAYGGGIENRGVLTAVNSTISYNQLIDASPPQYGGPELKLQGGGLRNLGTSGSAQLNHVSFVANGVVSREDAPGVLEGNEVWTSGPISLANSIVWWSLDPCFGVITDDGNNFGSDCFAGRDDVTGLEPLGANGGPTETHALSTTSNAVDAAGACGVPMDQRGISRLDACDSGAYELNPCDSDDPRYDDTLEGTDDGHDDDDDTCWGNELTLGVAQSHSHCDEDWAWFQPNTGKTYEIKTVNLQNGADTAISLFRDNPATTPRECLTQLTTDDNGGLGSASKLFYTAPLPHTVDIQVTEALDSYNPGSLPPSTVERYDLVVTCVENCDCALDGADLLLANDAVSTTVTYEACSTLTAEQFAVEEPAVVSFRAGEAVVFRNGVSIEGDLTVEIDPLLLP